MRGVFGRALSTHRGQWRQIAVIAFIALLPAAVLQGILVSLTNEAADDHPVAFLALAGAAVAAGLLGYFFLCGVLAQLTIARRRGHEAPSLREIARSLPYAQLIIADTVVSSGIALGLELLIVPGIVFGTWFSLAPPLIELRHIKAGEALRRSRELVRGSFWPVLSVLVATVALVYGLAIPIELVVDDIVPGPGELDKIVASFIAGFTIKPFAALTTVELALELDEESGV